jgi:phytoene desaturase
MNRIAIIGSGFSGLSAACFLAKAGFNVAVFEKNATPGGRARKFEAKGFTFDMGPSWYWMPDVFEKFFAHFEKKTSDYYFLDRLDPSYRIVFGKDDWMDVPANITALQDMFEKLEPGSSKHLEKFLAEGKVKYDIGIHKLVYKPGLSFIELIDPDVIKNSLRLHLLDSIASYIKKNFSAPRLVQLLQFPILFLGARPEKTPALYSLMNYADIALGTWYPSGGMYTIVEGMVSLATSLGVEFNFNCDVEHIEIKSNLAKGVVVNDSLYAADYIISSSDYHHAEQTLLPETHRTYSNNYWENRVMAPSCLIFYLGINKKLPCLLHHTLFFDEDFKKHADEIYVNPQWPTAPQFYVSCPSKTDTTLAPEGCENLFILIPVAAGLEDTDMIREKYFDLVLERLERVLGESVRENIVYKRSYAHNDFSNDYNSFKGNAYGLANTLLQTANLKPSIRSKKVKNLFFTGQLTVPGPGVPPALISGQIVANELIKDYQRSLV